MTTRKKPRKTLPPSDDIHVGNTAEDALVAALFTVRLPVDPDEPQAPRLRTTAHSNATSSEAPKATSAQEGPTMPPSTPSPGTSPEAPTRPKTVIPEGYTDKDAFAALFSVRWPMAPDGEPDEYRDSRAPKAPSK